MSGRETGGPEPAKRILREISSPPAGDDAASRIAEAAWERGRDLRGLPSTLDSTTGREAVPSVPSAPRVLRPRLVFAGACTAAAVVVAALLFVRGSEPAFAVEGDPVQVFAEERWGASRSVPLGSWVWVPEGTRAVRTGDGDSIEPRPGSVFRIVRSLDATPAWRVEMRRGDAEVSGTSFVLALCDQMEVVRSLEARRFRVHVSLGGGADAPPADSAVAVAGLRPVVRVLDGEARVAESDGPDLLLVRPQEAVTTVRVPAGGRTLRRLAFQRMWNASVPTEILHGAAVVDAWAVRAEGGADGGPGGDVALALRSPTAQLFTIRIPGAVAPSALAQVNLTTLLAYELTARIDLQVGADAPLVITEYLHRAAGRETLILVDADRSATLSRDGEVRRFASVAALRATEPDAAAPFGGKLR